MKIDRWFPTWYIQSKTGIDPGYLFKIFQGKKAHAPEKRGVLREAAEFTKREKEYI